MTDETMDGLMGIGFLGVVLIVLKLTRVVAWSWWIVTMPFWGSVVLISTFFLGIVVFGLLLKRVSESE